MKKHLDYPLILIALLLITCKSEQGKNDHNDTNLEAINDIEIQLNKAKIYFSYEDSLKNAIDIFQKTLQKSNAINYIPGIIRSHLNLGYTYTGQSKLAQATGHYYIGLKNATLIKDTVHISSSLYGLGLVMYNMNNWEEAKRYFTMALNLTNTDRKKSTTGYLLALCYKELKQVDVAKKHLLASKKIAEKNQDNVRLSEIRLALNNIKDHQEKNDSILIEYQNLYTYFQENNGIVGMAYTLTGMAEYKMAIGQYEEAQKFANQALSKAKTLNVIYPLQSILNTVTKAEFLNKNYEDAYKHKIELHEIKDSIQGLNAAAKVTLIQADYSFDKRKKELNDKIKSQNKQTVIWTSVAALLGLVVFLIFFLLKKVSKERKNSDKLLLNILPAHTAQELKKYGKAKAKSHQNVSIVFADIMGFTKIASGLSAEVIVEMLDIYFGEFDHILESFKLEKIKTIGDAYMFVGGLDGAVNSHKNTIDASLTMIERTNLLSKKMNEKYGISFSFRFGLHIGNVVSGVVGSKKYAFDIWGDAVNIAARLEEKSAPGKLNVSEQTYNRVNEHYIFEERGEIEAKNRGKIKMFYLLGSKKELS